MPSDMTSVRAQIVASLADKEYRDAFVQEAINQGIAFQIRAIRNQRGWTQGDLAERASKAQPEISRLEDPGYEGYTLKTLAKLASAFDVALTVRFIPFSALADEIGDESSRDFKVLSFDEDDALGPRSDPGEIRGADRTARDQVESADRVVKAAG